MNLLVTTLFVIGAHLLAPFGLRVFLEPGPVLEQAVAIVRTVAYMDTAPTLDYQREKERHVG